ncbi:hypothetical protein GDO81_000713 [Engystomops pustulosus]|uniref:Secreted protein n=1 Tax=Engystomops pustulosus TaxID=76066 RepID=A0AAV7D6J2_ENGPU|nr:hypothetical protein GDO81_000713 [Engystomops pustulosus]
MSDTFPIIGFVCLLLCWPCIRDHITNGCITHTLDLLGDFYVPTRCPRLKTISVFVRFEICIVILFLNVHKVEVTISVHKCYMIPSEHGNQSGTLRIMSCSYIRLALSYVLHHNLW